MQRFKTILLACVLSVGLASAPAQANTFNFFDDAFIEFLLNTLFPGLGNGGGSSQPNYNLTPSESLISAFDDGEVVVTFLEDGGDYSSDLSLINNGSFIFNSKAASEGDTFSLGNFQAGEEIGFNLFVTNENRNYFTGASALNPDNLIHTAYQQFPASGSESPYVVVGFEDLFNGGDNDFNDVVFSVSNAIITAVPEPSIAGMLLVGSAMIGLRRRKKMRVR